MTHYLLSADTVADAGDTLLATRNVPALAAGASSADSTRVVIPPGTPVGLWYLIAKADGPGSVPEVTETNNNATWGIQLGPDLSVSSLSAPTSPRSRTRSLLISREKVM